jgi:hypothetical protein
MADVMPKRIWNVRLNVDSFNAGFAGLENDQERLSFLAGFHGGLNGVSNNGKSTPFLAGWEVANECLTEAKAFSDKQRDRVNKRYQNVTTVEPRNNHGNTTVLPISTIQQSNNRNIEISSNDQPSAAPIADDQDLFAKRIMERDRQAQSQPLAYPPAKLKKTFADFRTFHPKIFVGKAEREDWESIFKNYEWDPMSEAYKALLAKSPNAPKFFLNQVSDWLSSNYTLEE